jgi:GntR family transcriptional regulator, transcriptional repressor for pyruvate dehydrogenase complex
MNQVGPSQKAFDFIVEQIRLKNWKPGNKIMSEMELCAELNISRVSVRQALDQLSAVGLLVKKHGSGTYVSKLEAGNAIDSLIPLILIEKKELLMLLEFRLYFESSNIEIFIDNATDKDISALKETYRVMVENEKNPEAFYFADFRFHSIIAEGTGNIFISKISGILTGILKSHQAHLYESVGPNIGLNFHRKLLEAIEEKDKDMAQLLMKRHIQKTIDQYKALTSRGKRN